MATFIKLTEKVGVQKRTIEVNIDLIKTISPIISEGKVKSQIEFYPKITKETYEESPEEIESLIKAQVIMKQLLTTKTPAELIQMLNQLITKNTKEC